MPSVTFKSFDLNPQILANVTALGYTTPTPIQQKAIPPILEGRDLMGLAQTGTGKTAAFLLPMLQKLMEGTPGQLRGLILAPTRELAQQINDAFTELAKGLKLRSVALYGGISIHTQKEKLRRGVDVVVACPGRLLDHVRQRTINLSHVEILVLDEADHMFDVGFLPDVRLILKQLPAKRQSLLFSATMPSEVRQLANDMLKNPVTVQIDNTTPVKTITQILYPIAQGLKSALLIKLLETHKIYSALVFTRTKHRAQRLAEQLEAAGYTATSLQGNLSQSKRKKALDDFRNGKIQILVATDIAARGIDVASISHVINFDFPDTVAAYTHRIGRTGRATKLGDAFTLLAREDSGKLRTLERALGMKIEQRMLPEFDYKASSHADSGMREERPRQHSARTPTNDHRPARRTFSGPKRFGQEEKAPGGPRSYSSRPRRPSNEQGRDPRSSGLSKTRTHGAAAYGSEKPAYRGKPKNGAGYSEKPAYREGSQSKTGSRYSDKPPSRTRTYSAESGDKPFRRPRTQGSPSMHNQSERPAGRGRPQRDAGGYSEKPANHTRPRGSSYSNDERAPSRSRPAGSKPPFKSGPKRPGGYNKPSGSTGKPKRRDD